MHIVGMIVSTTGTECTLIDWAEGRPQLSYQELKKKVAGASQKGDTLSLLQEGKLNPTEILSNWRMKKQLKIMQQEKAAKSSKHFNKNMVHLQNAIVHSKEPNSDKKAASEVKKAAGKSQV